MGTQRSERKSKLSYDRRSVGQSVMVSGHHLGPATDKSFIFMETIFRHSRVSSRGAPSLTRRQVCNLSVQLLLGLTSAVTLRFKSRRTRHDNLLSRLRLSSLLSPLTARRDMVEVFFPPSPLPRGFQFIFSRYRLYSRRRYHSYIVIMACCLITTEVMSLI
jgi:hypothetical protein